MDQFQIAGCSGSLAGDHASSPGEAASLDVEEEDVLDFDAQPEEVIARIEECAVWLAQQLGASQLPDLSLLAAPSASNQTTLQTRTLSLLGRHADSADRFARLWSILGQCHEVLVAGHTINQRELYYRLKPLEVFSSNAKHLGEAIQDAVLLLRLPRSSLGITCSSKGLVSGALVLGDLRSGYSTPCDLLASPGGRPIPGNISIISSFTFQSAAQAVLVIEKDTVFQQLAADPAIGGSGRFILVTGKGLPDMATRAFLAAMHAALPRLPLLGVVDWNPSGVGILRLYRQGSRRMAESARYALPALRWLGVRSGMLRYAAGPSFHQLSQRDRALLPGLRAELGGVAQAWMEELDAMEASESKADIEAVYSGCPEGAAGLGPLLAAHFTAGDWI